MNYTDKNIKLYILAVSEKSKKNIDKIKIDKVLYFESRLEIKVNIKTDITMYDFLNTDKNSLILKIDIKDKGCLEYPIFSSFRLNMYEEDKENREINLSFSFPLPSKVRTEKHDKKSEDIRSIKNNLVKNLSGNTKEKKL